MNKLLQLMRVSGIWSFCFAVLIGLIFRFIDVIARVVIWQQRPKFFDSWLNTLPNSKLPYLTVATNLTVDFLASLIAGILCSLLLVLVLQEKARHLSFVSVVTFLALSTRLWRSWAFPELPLQISGVTGPILAGLVFALSARIILKMKNRIAPASAGMFLYITGIIIGCIGLVVMNSYDNVAGGLVFVLGLSLFIIGRKRLDETRST